MVMGLKENVFKVSGWDLRGKAFKAITTGLAFVIIGIVLTIALSAPKALIISGLGLISVIWGWVLWKRSKSLVKGRYM